MSGVNAAPARRTINTHGNLVIAGTTRKRTIAGITHNRPLILADGGTADHLEPLSGGWRTVCAPACFFGGRGTQVTPFGLIDGNHPGGRIAFRRRYLGSYPPLAVTRPRKKRAGSLPGYP